VAWKSNGLKAKGAAYANKFIERECGIAFIFRPK
jgi:hypothetical protein